MTIGDEMQEQTVQRGYDGDFFSYDLEALKRLRDERGFGEKIMAYEPCFNAIECGLGEKQQYTLVADEPLPKIPQCMEHLRLGKNAIRRITQFFRNHCNCEEPWANGLAEAAYRIAEKKTSDGAYPWISPADMRMAAFEARLLPIAPQECRRCDFVHRERSPLDGDIACDGVCELPFPHMGPSKKKSKRVYDPERHYRGIQVA